MWTLHLWWWRMVRKSNKQQIMFKLLVYFLTCLTILTAFTFQSIFVLDIGIIRLIARKVSSFMLAYISSSPVWSWDSEVYHTHKKNHSFILFDIHSFLNNKHKSSLPWYNWWHWMQIHHQRCSRHFLEKSSLMFAIGHFHLQSNEHESTNQSYIITLLLLYTKSTK